MSQPTNENGNSQSLEDVAEIVSGLKGKKCRVTKGLRLAAIRARLRSVESGDPYDSDPALRAVLGEG